MPTTQLGGPIGPFLDNVQQRGVPVSVMGTVEYNTAGPVADPARLDYDVQNQLLGAIRNVIGQKMAMGQLQFRNLGEGTIGETTNEIIAASGLAQMGVHIGNLAMRFAIDNGPPQHEIRAHINVGGLHINASSTGGVNAASIGNQLVNKAKSAILWYVMGAVLVAVIGAVAWWYVKRTVRKAVDQSNPGAVAAAKWDGKSPLTCSGHDDFKIEGITATLPATAVTAGGNCTLTLVNVNLTAPTGIEAGGNAVVTVQGGSITSTTFAVHALGNAAVNLSGTKVSGKTQGSLNAKITGP